MLFLAGVVGILVATIVRFFAYRFLVFNEELDEEPEFSHDHEIIERHHHDRPGVRVEGEPSRIRNCPGRRPDAPAACGAGPSCR